MTEKELFGRFPLLNRISSDKKEQILLYFATAPVELLEHMAVERLPANTTFVLEGHSANYVYFVAKGAVKAIDFRFPGVEYEFMQFNKVVYAMGAMEILLERKEYYTTLKTAVPSIMIRCDAEAFGQWLCDMSPSSWENICWSRGDCPEPTCSCRGRKDWPRC